jgi:L-seryl-tRNA(Ser) seleniumtransferase
MAKPLSTHPDGPPSESPLRRLPAVHQVLDSVVWDDVPETIGRTSRVQAVRRAVEEARVALSGGRIASTDPDDLARRAVIWIRADGPRLRPVINATGVLLHTGLGRAPLALEALQAIERVARGYCNLEFDLETGERGRRTDSVAGLLGELTGAEAAAVVNNNAAATILALRGLARDREVVVSRGQLVEIVRGPPARGRDHEQDPTGRL